MVEPLPPTKQDKAWKTKKKKKKYTLHDQDGLYRTALQAPTSDLTR